MHCLFVPLLVLLVLLVVLECVCVPSGDVC